MSTTPKALELAGKLEVESDKEHSGVKYSTARQSAAELRRQHGEIEGLRAQVEALTKYAKPVYLIATGQVHEGLETYTRHDAPVPLADQEVLFTRPCLPLSGESETQSILSLADESWAPQPLTRPASEITEQVIRDVCELEPANPDLNDTLCVDVSDLKIIVDRALSDVPLTRPAVPTDTEILAVASKAGLSEFVSRTSRYELGNQLVAFGRALLSAAPQPEAAPSHSRHDARRIEIARIDAAMEATKEIVPRITRSQCKTIINAALAAEVRCEHCDGTGDVTDLTGEWRGYCTCEDGQALKAQKGGS